MRCRTVVLVIFSNILISAATLANSAKYTSGRIFSDDFTNGEKSPPMVVIPAGSYMMGSPEHEPGRYAAESPQHRVTFSKAFAIGQREVTVAEFGAFVEASGYESDAEILGGSLYKDPDTSEWTRGENINWRFDYLGRPAQPDYPVVHVTWHDAKAYVEWLSMKTGQRYRLPSEAEFEYVNRAGGTTIYSWGKDTPNKPVANIRGEKDQAITPSQLWNITKDERNYIYANGDTPAYFNNYGDGFGGVAPVASFPPNEYNVYDTTGNVWEWTEDCWNESYEGAPSDGRAWSTGNCEMRVLRGASFYCYPRHVRAANRWYRLPLMRSMYAGFRVARDL